MAPCTIFTSLGLMDAASTRTTAVSSPRTGSGRSTSFSPPSSPKAWIWMAFKTAPPSPAEALHRRPALEQCAVPSGQLGTGGVGAVGEFEDGRARVLRHSHLLIVQQELAEGVVPPRGAGTHGCPFQPR